jgi:3',5'-cyclic-AMP phosphodiesterase
MLKSDMIRLIQITDTHIYAEPDSRFDGVDTRASFATVFDHMHRVETAYDALVLTGDLAMDGSADAYAFLAQRIAAEDVPVLSLPGNHDEPAHLLASGLSSGTLAPHSVSMDGWRLVLLNTWVAGHAHGMIDDVQIEWLKQTLATQHDGFDAVFLHHQPVPIGSPWMDAMGLRGADALWSAIDAYGRVKLAVFGHVHQNFDHHRAGVRILGTPSTCVQFMPRATRYTADAKPPGYRVIVLGDDGDVSSSVVRVPC